MAKKKKEEYAPDVSIYCHCSDCMEALPAGVSPMDYGSTEVGITADGMIQVWCKRHKQLVAAFELKDPPVLHCHCGAPGCGGGMNPMKDGPLFEAGKVVLTPGTKSLDKKYEGKVAKLIIRHRMGDFGDLGKDDQVANFQAVLTGGRVVSSYKLDEDLKILIVTEEDRSVTTVMLPSEY